MKQRKDLRISCFERSNDKISTTFGKSIKNKTKLSCSRQTDYLRLPYNININTLPHCVSICKSKQDTFNSKYPCSNHDKYSLNIFTKKLNDIVPFEIIEFYDCSYHEYEYDYDGYDHKEEEKEKEKDNMMKIKQMMNDNETNCLEEQYWSEMELWNFKAIFSILHNFSILRNYQIKSHLVDKFQTFKFFQSSCYGFFDQYLNIQDLVSFDEVFYCVDWQRRCSHLDLNLYLTKFKSIGYANFYPSIPEINTFIISLSVPLSYWQRRLIWKSAYFYFTRLLQFQSIENRDVITLKGFPFLNIQKPNIDKEDNKKSLSIIEFENYQWKSTNKYILASHHRLISPKYFKGFKQRKRKGNIQFQKMETKRFIEMEREYFEYLNI